MALLWKHQKGAAREATTHTLRRLLSRRAPITALVRSRFLAFPALVALFD